MLTTRLSSGHQAWSRAHGLPPNALDTVLQEWRTRLPPEGNPVPRVESGSLGARDFERLLAEALSGRFGRPVEALGLLASILDCFAVDTTMVDTVAGIRTAGVRTVLVANSWGSGRPWDALGIFDSTVISYEVKARKPDPAIYREAVRRAGVPPQRCVFVDDQAVNVKAAVAMGIDGICHVETNRTVRELAERFPGLAATGHPDMSSRP